MKDTPPEVNGMIFAAMMGKTAEERLVMGFDMLATARQMVWAGIDPQAGEGERRRAFFRRFYGMECPW